MRILTSIQENGVTLIEIEGEVDAHTASDFDTALNSLLEQGNSRLIVDFSRLSFISSAGLRVLLNAQQKADKLGGGMRLFGLCGPVLQVFKLTSFDRIIPIVSDCREALEGW
jgi:anti-anti-sigma factor